MNRAPEHDFLDGMKGRNRDVSVRTQTIPFLLPLFPSQQPASLYWDAPLGMGTGAMAKGKKEKATQYPWSLQCPGFQSQFSPVPVFNP